MPLAFTVGGAGVEERIDVYVYLQKESKRKGEIKHNNERCKQFHEKSIGLCGYLGVNPSSVTSCGN